jgi:hypothetical protein
MKKTRWRKWWIVGDISSVCNADLLSSRRLKLRRQCHSLTILAHTTTAMTTAIASACLQ